MHEKGVTKLGSALLASLSCRGRRPGSLVGVRMLKTAWVCPRAAGRLAPRRPPRPPYPNPDSVKHERLFRLPGSSRAHVGADTSVAFSARSAAPAAPRRSAAARWCSRAPIRIPAAPAFGKHRLPKLGARDRRDDRHRARWPDFVNGVTIADPIARGRISADRPLAPLR
jgi:hypothetical protein